MGCLLLPFELILDLIIEGWFSLIQWILPEKIFSNVFRNVLKILIGIFSAILLIIFIIGILGAI